MSFKKEWRLHNLDALCQNCAPTVTLYALLANPWKVARTRWVSAKLLGRPHLPKIASNASSMPLDHLWYTIFAATNAYCRALKGVSLGSKLYAVRIITSKASTATSFKVSSCVRPSWNSPYNAVLSGLERLANGQRCPKEWHTVPFRAYYCHGITEIFVCEPTFAPPLLSVLAKASDMAHFADSTLACTLRAHMHKKTSGRLNFHDYPSLTSLLLKLYMWVHSTCYWKFAECLAALGDVMRMRHLEVTIWNRLLLAQIWGHYIPEKHVLLEIRMQQSIPCQSWCPSNMGCLFGRKFLKWIACTVYCITVLVLDS